MEVDPQDSPPCATTKALQELDRLQDLLLKATTTAAEAVKELGEHETLSEISVQDKFSDYVDLIKEVHVGLASKAHLVSNYVPYRRDCSALRREVDVLQLRLSLLQQELQGKEGNQELQGKEGGQEPQGGEGDGEAEGEAMEEGHNGKPSAEEPMELSGADK